MSDTRLVFRDDEAREKSESRVVSCTFCVFFSCLFFVEEINRKRGTITNGVDRLPLAYSAVSAAAHLSTMTEC